MGSCQGRWTSSVTPLSIRTRDFKRNTAQPNFSTGPPLLLPNTIMAEAAKAPKAGGGDGGHQSRNFHHEGEAFVTMVTSDDFVIGAETMLHSLRDHGNNKKSRQRALVVMVTPGVSELRKQALNAAADHVIEVSNGTVAHDADTPQSTGLST